MLISNQNNPVTGAPIAVNDLSISSKTAGPPQDLAPPAFEDSGPAFRGSVPSLSAPDVASVLAFVALITSNASDGLMQNAGESAKVVSGQKRDMFKESEVKRREAQKLAQDALDKQGESKIAAWCRVVFGVIGAALGMAAAAVTGGWAMAGAVIGMTMAVVDLANQIAQEAGATVTVDGKTKALDISIGGMVQAIVAQQEKDGTISFKDDAARQEYIMGMTIGANMLIMLAVLATGAGAIKDNIKLVKDAVKNVQGAVDKLKQNSQLLDVVGRTGSAVLDAGEGSTQVVQGAVGEQIAQIDYLKSLELAAQKALVAMSKDNGTMLKDLSTFLQQVSRDSLNIWSTLAETNKLIDDSYKNAARNMS